MFNLKTLRAFAATAIVTVSLGAQAFTTDTIDVATCHLPRANRVTVITPEAAKLAAEDAKFPAVYLLNGFGGDYTSWGTIRKDMGQLADNYGVYIIMPSGMNSWYWDSPVDSTMQMETFFVEDLVPFLRDNYKISTNPKLNAITGLSMGGHGGLWLGTRHPDLWFNIGSTSGGVDIRPFPKKWQMEKRLGAYEANPQVWDQSTVINIVDKMKENGQNIIFDCGSEDFFAQVNANLHKALLDAKVPHDYISRPGVHNSKYWANSILFQLLYFDQAFKKALAEEEVK